MTPRDPLSSELRKLQSVEPTPELEVRLMRALVAEERAESTKARQRHTRRAAWISNLRLSLPALASVAIAAHLVWHDPSVEHVSFTEYRLELSPEGNVTLPLSFSLDEHDAEFATVRLDVPHGVSVSAMNETVKASQPDCHSKGCIYEFLHPTTSLAPHVEVRVAKPGRYRVEVEHESDSKLLRQVFVVHASR